MRKLRNLFIIVVTVLSAVALSTGCSNTDSIIQPTDGGHVNLQLNIAVLEASQASSKESRAVVDDENYFEAPIEEHEKMNTLRIIIVRADETVEHNRFIYLDAPDVKAQSTFKVIGGETKKIYLFANEPDGLYNFGQKVVRGTRFPKGDIEGLTLTCNDNGVVLYDNTGETKTYLPMSEQFDVDVEQAKAPGITTPDQPNQVEDLFVTRAAVKFSFTAKYEQGSEVQTYQKRYQRRISEITISRIGNKEYLLPTGTTYDPKKGTPSYYDPNRGLYGRFITAYTVPTEAENKEYTFFPGEALTLTAPAEQKSYTPLVYFPETAYTPEGASNQVYQVRLKLELKDEAKEEGQIEVVQSEWVTLSNPYLSSLPRNTHVVVNITLRANEITYTVDVVPYAAIELNPEYGNIFDEDGKDYIVTWPSKKPQPTENTLQ